MHFNQTAPGACPCSEFIAVFQTKKIKRTSQVLCTTAVQSDPDLLTNCVLNMLLVFLSKRPRLHLCIMHTVETLFQLNNGTALQPKPISLAAHTWLKN